MNNKKKYLNLLSCWHKLEHFTPAIVPPAKDIFDFAALFKKYEKEPWNVPLRSKDKQKSLEYTVFLGVFQLSIVNDFVKKFFGDKSEDYNFRSSKICFASIKLDENGKYLDGSFGLSTLPWALTQLKNNKINDNSWAEEWEKILDGLTKYIDLNFKEQITNEKNEIIKISKVLSKDMLISFQKEIEKSYKWQDFERNLNICNNKKIYVKISEKFKSQKNETEPEILNSFYVKDLEKIISCLKKKIKIPKVLKLYLNGSLNIFSKNKRKDVRKNVNILKSSLIPKNYPDGCWPSDFKLNLMQQFSINTIINNLMKHNQSGIFSVNGPPGTGKTTLLRDLIAAIIVNRAKKLCKIKIPSEAFKETGKMNIETGNNEYNFNIYKPVNFISDGGILIASSNNNAVENITKELPLINEVGKSYQNISYFEEVAKKCLSTDYWGIVAAVLGKKENRNQLVSNLWFDNANNSNNKITLKNFLKENKKNNNDDWKKIKEDFYSKLKEIKEEKRRLEKIRKIENKLNLLYWFNKLGCFLSKNEIEKIKRELGSNNYADENFWNKIETKETQEACPWYSDSLRKLNSELFILALKLHETFILSANSKNGLITTTLAAFFEYLKGEKQCSEEEVKAMWDTFFLVFPVVSSTFASIQSMLKDMREESIPWLFIDEAGQAVPQSAVGAIWRSKRVCVVGDPYQIEPVVTIPETIVNNIGKYFILNQENLSSELSVQSMADRINPIGTYMKDNEWIGIPLRVHKRCIDPMFSIANKIAYNGFMFCSTPIPDEVNVQFNTDFLDCKGNIKGRHFVPAQAIEVKTILINEIKTLKNLPDIFIISPFVEVAKKLKEYLFKPLKKGLQKYSQHNFKLGEWLNTHIGTIHTFQGKQAEGVILCLGLDNTCEGAANWASRKPNLLNVALTRAKYRFVAIGDQDIWLNKNYFEKLKELK
ncbi:MAG: AAA domain-containing protein [Brevinematia bacterium]